MRKHGLFFIPKKKLEFHFLKHKKSLPDKSGRLSYFTFRMLLNYDVFNRFTSVSADADLINSAFKV